MRQRLRGPRRPVPARRARRRRPDRAAEDRCHRRLLRWRHLARARRPAHRTQLPDGSLVPWTSPPGKPMAIAATVPEFTWSDLATSLNPNGSSLDYVAHAPYWAAVTASASRSSLEPRSTAAALLRLLRPDADSDPTANITGWQPWPHRRPVDPDPVASSSTSSRSTTAPTARRQRRARPGAAVQRLERRPVPGRRGAAVLQQGPREPPDDADLDVPPRPRPPDRSAASGAAADARALTPPRTRGSPTTSRATGDAPRRRRRWRHGRPPASARSVGAARVFHAKNWASLAKGEVRLADAAAQTVAADTTPANRSPRRTRPTPSPTSAPPARRGHRGCRDLRDPAAPTGGYTIAGAPTILADLAVKNATTPWSAACTTSIRPACSG